MNVVVDDSLHNLLCLLLLLDCLLLHQTVQLKMFLAFLLKLILFYFQELTFRTFCRCLSVLSFNHSGDFLIPIFSSICLSFIPLRADSIIWSRPLCSPLSIKASLGAVITISTFLFRSGFVLSLYDRYSSQTFPVFLFL